MQIHAELACEAFKARFKRFTLARKIALTACCSRQPDRVEWRGCVSVHGLQAFCRPVGDTLTERKERWALQALPGKDEVGRPFARPPVRRASTITERFSPSSISAFSQWSSCPKLYGVEIRGLKLEKHAGPFRGKSSNALMPFEDDERIQHCVTDPWSKYDCRWAGVAFFTLVDLVRPKPEARFVYFTSYDGYSTNTALENCLDDDVLVATQFDGKPITKEHGGPARVIIPKLYAWKGAKFVRTHANSSALRQTWLLGGARLQQHPA